MYLALSLLFSILIIAGALLTLILFKFDMSELKNSGLDKKILMWIPFSIIFLLALYLGPSARLAIFIVILLFSVAEFIQALRKQLYPFVVTYFIIYIIAFLHLGLIRIYPNSFNIIVYLLVGTVISDVCGFFFGNFFGWHKLPEMFNKRKSWEGVLGQIIGALIGVLLIKYFILNQGNLLLFLPIGFGATLGDLMNSRAKKLIGIKNWSNLIPGHGGFIDRFCSLAGSSILTFYFILVFLR